MLKQILSIAALVPILLIKPIDVAAQGYPEHQLLGTQVKALLLTYGDIPNSSGSALLHTQVRVSAENRGVVDILVSSPVGYQALRIDTGSGKASNVASAQLAPPALSLSGYDLKAIALVQGALESGEVRGLPIEAIKSGAFSIREAFVYDTGHTKLPPAYVISYLRAGGSWDPKPFPHCNEYINYTVDPSTWRVLIQPPVC